MTHKNKILFTVCSVSVLLIISGCSSDDNNNTNSSTNTSTASLELASGESQTITSTKNYSSLTLSDASTLTTTDGKRLTLTVDGVQTPIAAGSYSGDIVVTVTDDIPITYRDLEPHSFRTALYVEDGEIVEDKSVLAAISSGEVTNNMATGVNIQSNGENFNGMLFTSSSDDAARYNYTVDDLVINFTGNGGNDFAGFGAAIMSDGNTNVTVNNAKIITEGAIRTGVFVGGNSNIAVNDSYIEVNNGTLPEDYSFTVSLGEMMEVPWMLGLTGNVRATNLVGNGTAHYNNTTIKAQGWGAMSVDDTESTRLYGVNCTIETVESGYGAYSIGDSIDHFSNCQFNVNDYGLIMAAEGSGVFTNGSVINSGRFGVMVHSNGNGTLTVDGGSVINAEEAVIQAKGSFPTIEIDNAQLNSTQGILLQLMANDDPFLIGFMEAMAGSDDLGGLEELMAGSGEASVASASFANSTLEGDIIHGNTASGNLSVSLENTTLTGAITTATTTFQYQDDGYAAADLTANDYGKIGRINNTYQAQDSSESLNLTLDPTTVWNINNDSHLTSLTIEDGATINPITGYTLTMTVDGIETDIIAGEYNGMITLALAAQ